VGAGDECLHRRDAEFGGERGEDPALESQLQERLIRASVGACMTKAKKKATSKKKSSAKTKKAAVADFREVRRQVKNAICDEASEIAKEVAGEVKSKKQVASMKTLFEVIGLFPESPEEREAAGDDQALAKVLLERLGLSDEPQVSEEEAAEKRALEASALAVMGAPGDPVE
jgi:hypothetical protein